MSEQDTAFCHPGFFCQIAVSNQELYRLARRKEKEEREAYTDFLAGLACGHQTCLHRNVKPDILIIREKQLSEIQYVELFAGLWEKVEQYKQKRQEETALLIPHTYPLAARQTGSAWLHLTLPLFRKYRCHNILSGLQTGVSVHSAAEAAEAQKLGAAYVIAGHIFRTDCKKGVVPRGLDFLEQVCASVTIPVYAIGGVHENNMFQIQKRGAAGACRMSEYML